MGAPGGANAACETFAAWRRSYGDIYVASLAIWARIAIKITVSILRATLMRRSHCTIEIPELGELKEMKTAIKMHRNLVVLDLRKEETIWAANRFLIYALYPQCNISIHVLWGVQKQNTVFATGKSILDRGSKTDIGALMLQYGGGGHTAAGTCQVENEQAEDVLAALIHQINADG